MYIKLKRLKKVFFYVIINMLGGINMNDVRKRNICIGIILILLLVFSFGYDYFKARLPKPEVTSGERGELGIDKNINEKNINKYLFREDSVYRDVRMLEDPGNYESIGGDSKLSGFVEGFEVISLPYIIPVSGLPESVGDTYTGDTLFSKNDKGNYVANYEESMDILEYYFPKDKNIFLMCGGGGYAGMMKNLLVDLGWDENKIYNVGGYWYYDGKYNVKVKEKKNGKTKYNFWKVNYHNIDFDSLHKINE